jgi:hypothetical protein
MQNFSHEEPQSTGNVSSKAGRYHLSQCATRDGQGGQLPLSDKLPRIELRVGANCGASPKKVIEMLLRPLRFGDHRGSHLIPRRPRPGGESHPHLVDVESQRQGRGTPLRYLQHLQRPGTTTAWFASGLLPLSPVVRIFPWMRLRRRRSKQRTRSIWHPSSPARTSGGLITISATTT